MENKFATTVLILTMLPCVLCAQIYYDAASRVPVFRLSKDKQDSIKVEYYLSSDSFIVVDTDVQFKNGVKKLYQYFDSLYYNNFTSQTYKEVNRWESYSILFDDKLKIKDIHIIAKPGRKEYDSSYDKLIKRIFSSTEGMWYKTNKNNNWSLYLGFLRIK